jgi:hypothetical protein
MVCLHSYDRGIAQFGNSVTPIEDFTKRADLPICPISPEPYQKTVQEHPVADHVPNPTHFSSGLIRGFSSFARKQGLLACLDSLVVSCSVADVNVKAIDLT